MIHRRCAAAWLVALTAFVACTLMEFIIWSEANAEPFHPEQESVEVTTAAHHEAFQLMKRFKSPQDLARANFTASSCKAVVPVHPHFHLQLCMTGCKGVFLIERVADDVMNGTLICSPEHRLSNHSLTEQWIRQQIGPDAFMFRFLGPDVVMGDTTYAGPCKYESFFELFTAETYNVRADVMYTNYTMVDERNYHAVWPPLLYTPLILDPKYTVTCGSRGMATAKHPDLPHQSSNADLPFCKDGLHRGRWVQDQWYPVGCVLRPISRIVGCLKDKKVAIFGDSHLLRTFRGLRIALDPSFDDNASQIPAIRNLKTATTFNIPHLNLSLTYIKAPFMFYSDLKDGKMCCEVPVQEYLTQFDFNILGFGQHPAAGCCCCNQDGHWPFLRYVDYVYRLLPMLNASLGHRQPVIWIGITAWQPKKHNMKTRFNLNGEKKSLDWRNNYRLSMYNRFAYAVMQKIGVKVVDAFQISYPMMHTTKDGAHYLGMVQRNIVHEVLNSVGAWCDGLPVT